MLLLNAIRSITSVQATPEPPDIQQTIGLQRAIHLSYSLLLPFFVSFFFLSHFQGVVSFAFLKTYPLPNLGYHGALCFPTEQHLTFWELAYLPCPVRQSKLLFVL